MKKFLLGTTALGAFALAASVQASPLSVKVGGEIDFQASSVDQDLDAGVRNVKFANDTEIHVNVEGKSDNGLVYGAVIELEADVSADARGEGQNADKTFIFLETDAGRFELGNNTAAADALSVGADSIAVATGGIDGDWYLYATSTAGFAFLPDLPVAAARGVSEDASKITYFTPRFNGFQAGVSYTPDQGDGGTAAGFTGENNGDFENVISAGLSFNGEFENVGVMASVNGEFGDSETAGTEDLSAYELGLALTFEGFSVAGSWGDHGESGYATGSNIEADYFTLGAAYDAGNVGLSVTYLNGNVDLGAAGENESQVISVGADYALAPGLTPYIEANFFELDAPGTASDNDGTVVLVGSTLSF